MDFSNGREMASFTELNRVLCGFSPSQPDFTRGLSGDLPHHTQEQDSRKGRASPLPLKEWL
jgi:hypothetical protein